jgi:hypothetical protein
MSNSIIEDGTGKGYKAKVSPQNHLAVDAINVEEVTHISSREGGAYTLHFKRTLAAADTLEDVGHFTYTGDYKLQINTCTLSREDVALTSGDQAFFELMTGASYTSGGDALVANNLNLGSSNNLDVTAYTGTTTIVTDKTNEKDLYDIVVRDTEDIEFKGSLILNKGDSLTIVTRSKNIGDIAYVVLSCFEVKEVI